MIGANELKALMDDLESDRVERTVSLAKTAKFSEAVCAFANDLPRHRKPGYLLIGVRDDGSASGLQVTDQLLQNLAALRSDGNILPLPALTVEKVALPEGDVAVVEVRPSDLPPVRYHGRVWVRIGPRRAVASEQEERVLSERRVSNSKNFDATPCLESTIGDLALPLFEAYRRESVAADIIESNHRDIQEQLASLRFYDLQKEHPTNAGVLLFGSNPRYFLPGAYIQYLRFPGDSMTDLPQDQAEISGDLLSVMRELDARVRAGNRASLHAESALRESVQADYPEMAIREILVNAVVHRNYESNSPVQFYWFDHKIEIQNPGGLYGEATPENYLRQNSYRNPVLAEAMKNLGYVNRFGYGIQRAQKLLRDNGNPPAEFTFEQQAVGVVLRRGGQ